MLSGMKNSKIQDSRIVVWFENFEKGIIQSLETHEPLNPEK
jgi:hypothetical protein